MAGTGSDRNGSSEGGAAGSRRRRPDTLSLIRRVLEEAGPGAIDLALGAPRHPVPEPVRHALNAAVEASDGLAYTANAGRADLRRVLARRRPHHGTSEDSVIVTVGSQEGLALAVLGLVEAGDEVLIPELSYPSYRTLPELADARVRPVPLAGIPGAVGPRTRMVIVGSPGNPTGTVIPESRLEALAELAAETGFHLVSDEVYEEIWLEGDRPAHPVGERVIHVGSISKSLAAPGLRLGWLVAAPSVTARLVPLHQHLVTCAPSPAQAAALESLSLPDSELDVVRGFYRKRWKVLRRALGSFPAEVTWREPRGAFYVLLDVRRQIGAGTRGLALDLARRGRVLVVPGEAFGPAGAGFLRIAFTASPEEIEEGAERLRKALLEAG